jgi:hypothetical protein
MVQKEREDGYKEMMEEFIEVLSPYLITIIKRKHYKDSYDSAVDNIDEKYQDILRNPIMKGFLLTLLGEKIGNKDIKDAGYDEIIKIFNDDNFIDQMKSFMNKKISEVKNK